MFIQKDYIGTQVLVRTEKVFGDRLGKEMKYLGKRAVEIDNKIKNRIKKLWQQRLEKR